MFWRDFYKQLKAGEVKGVYLFEGEEEYVKKEAVKSLREAILPEGLEALNESVYDGGDISRIIESAETLPVMCDRRLVLVMDWPPIMRKAKAETEEDAPQTTDARRQNGGDLARLKAWIPNAPDTCVTVFYVHGTCANAKAFENAQIVSFPYLEGAELTGWIKKQAKNSKKTFSAGAADMLTFLAGTELTRLEGEISKLCAYVGDETEITEACVRAVVAPNVESNVFEMIDALMAANAKKAYEILNAMLDAGENCVMILSMITRQLRLLTNVRYMQDSRAPYDEIKRYTGFKSDYAVRKITQQASRIPAKRLEEIYRQGVNCDFEVKNGRIRDRLAIDRMMMTLCDISR